MKNLKSSEWPVRALVFKWYLATLMGVFGCLFGANLAYAQADAYSVEVAVSDRSVSEQNDAYVVAFRRVLLNNSGDKTLLNRNEIRSGLNSAEEYVSGFTYRTPPPGTVISTETPITSRVRTTGEARQLMMVTFDREQVKALIDSSSGRSGDESEPAAPRQSNSALVWMLIQDDGRDIMISDPEARNVQSRAREIAGALGISLIFPSGDGTDKENVSIDDFLQMNVDNLLAASERYEQRTVLIGNLFRNSTGRGWQGEWLRVADGEQTESEYDSNTLDEALQMGMNALVSSEASADSSYRYGGPAASGTEGLVWVGSVSSLADYASLIRFFEAVPNVGTVYPKEVGDTSMTFAVLPRSALRDVENAMPSQRWLRRSAPTLVEDAGGLAQNADLALEIDR